MSEDKAQEKTQEPTPKRLEDARKKGQTARSKELSTMMVLLSASTALYYLGGPTSRDLMLIMREHFVIRRESLYDSSALFPSLLDACAEALLIIIPLLMVSFVIAIASPMMIGGWSFSTSAMAFKMDKMNPIKGIGRIFSVKSIVELIKALAKFSIVLFVACMILYTNYESYLYLGTQDFISGINNSASLLVIAFIILSSSLIVIALVDVPFQIWDHTRQLKMTHQEIKDEMKQTEGMPEVKQKIREKQRELSERRMMDEVPTADVIIVNPSHYSVAIRYDDSRASAPIVIAKGVDFVALQIRNIANTNNIPIVSSPPLARAIYYNTEINDEIPAGLFLAIAKVLAYIYGLNAAEKLRKEHELDGLQIPDDLQHD